MVYFRTVRGLRTVAAGGKDVTDPEREADARELKRTRESVQEAMRDDLRSR